MSNRHTDVHLDDLKQMSEDGPVVMINLVKLRDRSLDGDGSGQDAFDRYGKQSIRILKAHGGRLIWSGKAEHVPIGDAQTNDWDYIALFQWPSRAAFCRFIESDAYAAINHHRVNGLEKHLVVSAVTTYGGLPRDRVEAADATSGEER